MVDHKKTPDILGDLLGGAPEPEKKPAVQASSSQPQSHNTGIPVSQQAIKPARKKEPAAPPAPIKQPEEASGDKVKATFYISTEAVEALEDGWIKLRRLAPKDQRGQISKSLIVELAVQMALEELESKSDKSQIARRIRK